jgi:uncharacterized protein YcnI
MTLFHKFCFAATCLLLAAVPASAHVTLEAREATVGTHFKAVFRVPHGCGVSPTVKLRVRIPAGFIAAKPMPKPGWTLELTRGKYDKTYAYLHGAQLSEGVTEITWSGKLPDDYYDEFVVAGFVADALTPGAKLYFPVVQECEQGVHRWIEIPKAGASAPLHEPAPGIMLLPKK